MIPGLVASGVATSTAITDTFSEANGTNINGKATTTGGKTWVVGGGTLDVNTGKARVTAGSGTSWATVDAGISDFDMTFTLLVGASSIDGAMFRVVNGSNYFRLDANPGLDKLFLLVNVAGTESDVVPGGAAVAAFATGSTHTLRVRAVGTSLKVYWNGSLTIDTTNSNHLTATKHGFIGFNTATRFDDFSLAAA